MTLRAARHGLLSHTLAATAAAAAVLAATVSAARGGPQEAEGAADDRIAAVVDNQSISVAEVDGLVRRSIGARPADDTTWPALQAEALEQLIGQILVVEYLVERGAAASDADVQLATENLKRDLQFSGLSLAEYQVQQHHTAASWARQIRFRESWNRYLQEMLSAENLARHFERFRAEFDGTQRRVQHILLRCQDDAGDEAEVGQRAMELKGRIESGAIDWATAARDHSAAPTAANEGELGWIERRGATPEPLAEAAFALASGEISAPVRTRFGWHLIRCMEVRPGTRVLADVEDEVRRHATQYLFRWIVDRQRDQSVIEYTGNCPHRDPHTGALIPAA